MKKVLLSLLLCTFTATGYAQYRDVKLPEAPKHTNYRDYETQDNGFWFAAEAEGASSAMPVRRNMQFASATFTTGYRFNEFLRLGVGLGTRTYVNNADVRDTENRFAFPVFANMRGNFISAYDRDGVPFWSINAGYAVNDGVFASPTIGYSFGGLRNNFLIGISYTISRFKDYKKENTTFSYFGLKLGYEF